MGLFCTVQRGQTRNEVFSKMLRSQRAVVTIVKREEGKGKKKEQQQEGNKDKTNPESTEKHFC